jgi:hypothetical protein
MIFEVCWILAVHVPAAMSTGWFSALPAAERTTRLLHSIYTFDCQQVLAVMLAQRLAEDPIRADALLDTENPERAHYLEFIIGRLAVREPRATPATDTNLGASLLTRITGKVRGLLATPRAST